MRNGLPLRCPVVLLTAVLIASWSDVIALAQADERLTLKDLQLVLDGRSVVDIEYDTILGQPAVWVGTDSGAYVSTDVGDNWTWVTTADGLNANSISAVLLHDDTVWLGMSHSQDFGGDLFPVGDGFNFSTNGGGLWDTTLPPQSTGIGYFSEQIFGMLPFDISGEPSELWAACFFGGLIRSTDGGLTWFNIFPSVAARSDFESKTYAELGNRFFSVAAGLVDAAGDTTEIYAGSAGGINRFLIIGAGISHGDLDGEVYAHSPRDTVDLIELFQFEAGSDSSISGDFVVALEIQDHGGQKTVWASTRPVTAPQFDAVSRSTDHGRTWEVSLAGRVTWNFAIYDERVWAATSGGLFHTTDAGTTWQEIVIPLWSDTVEILSVRQIDDSTLLVGSEVGLARSWDLGQSWPTAVDEDQGARPSTLRLAGNYPNPFNASTIIRYSVPEPAHVTVTVYNLLGRMVTVLHDALAPAGEHSLKWDGRDQRGHEVASGVYFYRLAADGRSETRRMLLLR